MSRTLPYLRPRKPRVGLFMTAGDWFWEIAGDLTKSRFAGLAKIAEDAAAKVEKKLAATMEVVSSGVIRTAEAAIAATEKFRTAHVDMVVVCNLIWSEDQPVHELLRRMPDVPLILWCYQIEGTLPDPMDEVELFKLCGPVGTLQNSGVIYKAGRDIGFVFGPSSDEQCLQELNEYAQAARVAQDLRGATIGLLPHRYVGMMSTYVDEFRLATEVGPAIRHISVAEFKQRVDAVEDKKVKAFVDDLKQRFKILPEVTEDNLYQSSRISLGFAKLIEEMNLDGMAIQDLHPELHEVIGTRPCICVPEMYQRGCVVTMEGEIGLCLGMMCQRQLSGHSPMYVEVFSYDMEQNLIVAGHAGMHDADSLSRGDDYEVVTNDYEYDQLNELKGVWRLFTAKPGRVTLLSLVDSKDCFQMTIARGESLDIDQILFGNSNMNIRFDVSLREFFEQAARAGVTQHWAVAYGDTTSQLQKLAWMLGMRVVMIE